MTHDQLARAQRDWELVPLSDVSTPVRRRLSATPQNVLMISSTQGFIHQSDRYSRFMAGESLSRYVELHDGEFAYNKGNSKTYPQGCIFQLKGFGVAAVPHVYFCFRLNESRVLPRFAAQFFQAGGLNAQLKRRINTGVRNNGLLNIAEPQFYSVCVPIAPLEEQRRIIDILSSFDELIESTRAVIAQLEVVKRALMNELLMHGMPGRHKEFKTSEIGDVPKGWSVSTIGDMAANGLLLVHKDGNYGSDYPRATEFGPVGVPFLSARNISEQGELQILEAPRLNEERAKRLRFGFVREGDVLLAHNATVGPVVRVPAWPGELLISTSLTCFRPNTDCLDSSFLAAQLSAPSFQAQLKEVMGQTTRNQVPITKQRELILVLPSVSEQREIGSAIASSNERIFRESRKLAAIAALKVSLLDGLLGGQVQMPVGSGAVK